jgi:hypothetical protein
MELVKVDRGTLTLPPETLQIVGADAQFTVITAGDTIILKKVTPSRLSEIAERAPQDQPMALGEIVKEIKRYRRSRRARRR